MSANLSASEIQHGMLLTFMESHTLFARKQITQLGICGVNKYRQMWKNLSSQLNLIGPAENTVEKWEAIWDDMRLDAKNCMQEFLYASRQTGQHDVQLPHPNIQRICNLFGLFGIGLPVIPELGVYNSNASWHNQTQYEINTGVMEKYTSDLENNDLKEMSSTIPQNEAKLSSEQLKYIAAFCEGKEEGMTMHDWENLSKKPALVALKKSGEWLKAAWELEVERALNRRFRLATKGKSCLAKLTLCEKAILQAVSREPYSTVDDEEDEDVGDKEEPALPLFQQSQASQKKKGIVPVRQWSPTPSEDDEPGPSGVCTSAKSLLEKYTAARSAVYSNPIQNKRKIVEHLPPPTSSKKQKMTGLKAQLESLGSLQEGNQIVATLVDLLIESFRAHTSALQGLTLIVQSGFDSLKEQLKELSEQITVAFINQKKNGAENEEVEYDEDDSEIDPRILQFLREEQERERLQHVMEAEEREAFEDRVMDDRDTM